MKYYILIISLIIIIPLQGLSQNNFYLQAQVAYEKGEFNQSSEYINNYLKDFPKNLKALFLRAKNSLELHNYNQALNDLSLFKSTYHKDILLMLARANAGMNKNKEALELLEKYLQSNKKQPLPVIQSYIEFNSLKTLDGWNALWTSERYSKKEQLLNNAIYAIKSKRFDEANDRLDEIINRYQSCDEAYLLKGNLLLSKKDFTYALENFEKAIELEEDNFDYQSAKGVCLARMNKSKKALEIFDKLLNEDSLYLPGYKGRAEAFLMDNDFENADKDIQKYMLYYPEDGEAQYLFAAISVKGGDFLNAISSYGKLIKENPGQPNYFIGRAKAYMATKTYKYAIKDFSMALDLDPKNVEVYKQKALAHKLTGEMKNACNEWKHAADLGDIESLDYLHKYCK